MTRMKLATYGLIVVTAAFGLYNVFGTYTAGCRWNEEIEARARALTLNEPTPGDLIPVRVSITDKHLRTCRRFCRTHGQFPVRRIDVQGTSVRCVCSGATAPDAEVSE